MFESWIKDIKKHIIGKEKDPIELLHSDQLFVSEKYQQIFKLFHITKNDLMRPHAKYPFSIGWKWDFRLANLETVIENNLFDLYGPLYPVLLPLDSQNTLQFTTINAISYNNKEDKLKFAHNVIFLSRDNTIEEMEQKISSFLIASMEDFIAKTTAAKQYPLPNKMYTSLLKMFLFTEQEIFDPIPLIATGINNSINKGEMMDYKQMVHQVDKILSIDKSVYDLIEDKDRLEKLTKAYKLLKRKN